MLIVIILFVTALCPYATNTPLKTTSALNLKATSALPNRSKIRGMLQKFKGQL